MSNCKCSSFRLEDLRLKLENEGLVNISYVVVNHQGKHSQVKYDLLKSKVSAHIPVYQQHENQPDVWSLLKGNKDDFFIYDRCGRLVQHLELPYTFLSFPYVEEAIKIAYCENKCGSCKNETPVVEDICKIKPEDQPTEDKPVEEPIEKPSQRKNHHRQNQNKHRHQQQEGDIVIDNRQAPNQQRGHGHGHHHNEDQVVEDQNRQSGQVLRPHSRNHHSRVAGRHGLGPRVVETVPQREVIFVPQREADIAALDRKP
ncbi:hypothetical protein FKM82_029048 [Ascaphus truei]